MNPETALPDCLFVYGTLRREASPMHQMLAKHSQYLGNGTVQGQLYEVACYPGAVESANPDDQVIGELYRIRDPRLLVELDAYEACDSSFPAPHEYVRKACWIRLTNDTRQLAWVYIYNHPLHDLRRIESGDYLR